MPGWIGAEWPVNQSAQRRLRRACLCLSYPCDLRSAACRMVVERGAWSGRLDKSNATQKGQGAGGRVAGSAQGP